MGPPEAYRPESCVPQSILGGAALTGAHEEARAGEAVQTHSLLTQPTDLREPPQLPLQGLLHLQFPDPGPSPSVTRCDWVTDGLCRRPTLLATGLAGRSQAEDGRSKRGLMKEGTVVNGAGYLGFLEVREFLFPLF